MKLTPENKKALEDDVIYGMSNIDEGSRYYSLLGAAALLLEIWEPLQEMVEARGKIGEVVWTEYHDDYDISDGFGHVGSFEHKETRDFAIKAANALTAIRKAVG